MSNELESSIRSALLDASEQIDAVTLDDVTARRARRQLRHRVGLAGCVLAALGLGTLALTDDQRDGSVQMNDAPPTRSTDPATRLTDGEFSGHQSVDGDRHVFAWGDGFLSVDVALQRVAVDRGGNPLGGQEPTVEVEYTDDGDTWTTVDAAPPPIPTLGWSASGGRLLAWWISNDLAAYMEAETSRSSGDSLSPGHPDLDGVGTLFVATTDDLLTWSVTEVDIPTPPGKRPHVFSTVLPISVHPTDDGWVATVRADAPVIGDGDAGATSIIVHRDGVTDFIDLPPGTTGDLRSEVVPIGELLIATGTPVSARSLDGGWEPVLGVPAGAHIDATLPIDGALLMLGEHDGTRDAWTVDDRGRVAPATYPPLPDEPFRWPVGPPGRPNSAALVVWFETPDRSGQWGADLWLIATVDGADWLTLDIDDPPATAHRLGPWVHGAAINGVTVVYPAADGSATAAAPG